MDWQRRRGRLNHDWLKNQFLTALSHLENIGRDLVEDPEFPLRFHRDILPQWQERRKEILDLGLRFEEEMSPRVLFRCEPLSLIPGMQEDWMIQLIHALWWVRVRPDRLLSALYNALENCDRAWHVLSTQPPNSTAPIDPEPVHDFRVACLTLAHVISSYPTSISVL
jgi:hypothetical protein